MSDPIRVPFLAWLTLVVFAAGILAAAWWDWTYPGSAWMWWQGERLSPFFWRQLRWALSFSVGICLALWGLSAFLTARREGLSSRVLSPGARTALPFSLSFAALPFFIRHAVHPLGLQPGSAAWTYGLVLVTASVLAFPLANVLSLRTASVPRARIRGLIGVYILVALYIFVFGALAFARHASFRSHALDMGTMDQAVWNTSRGRILERTPLYRNPADGSRYENRLLDAKLELVLIPLSAFYWLWSDPRLLLAAQTAFLAAGAIPLYGLAIDHLHARNPGGTTDRVRPSDRQGDSDQADDPLTASPTLPAVLLVAAYLLYLPLHYVQMADFHPSALMIPLLIAAWRAMNRGRWKRYYVWLALAMCCRIDAAFTALVLGMVLFLWRGVARQQGDARRHGWYTVAFAAAWLSLDLGIVAPLVRRWYGPGAGDLVLRRFGTWGDSPLDIVRTMIAQPGRVLASFAGLDKVQVLFDLLAPAGFVPLLGPLALLPALPVLAINLLADSSWQQSIHAHYMAPVIPYLWIAAVEGVAWVARGRGSPARRMHWARVLAALSLLCSLGVSMAQSPFPPGKDFALENYWQPSSHSRDIAEILALVPDEATVCAQSDLHPHLSQRRDACLFPLCALDDDQETEYVVLDLDATSTKSPMSFHAFYLMVDLWLTREDYGVIAQRGGVLLLQRGAPHEANAGVLSALDTYGRELYRVDYLRAATPGTLAAGDLIRVPVTLRNAGSQAWHSRGQLPVRLSYRWWTTGGSLLLVDPMRTDLPHRVEPGHEVNLRAWVRTPTEPGRYILEWDIVREGDAWFGDKGADMLRQVVTVK